MTVDSVGEIDEEMDADMEALLNETQMNEDGSEENDDKDRVAVGGEFVKEITAFYCEICEHYSADKTTLEAYKKKHCLQRSHLKAYLRYKEEEKLAKKRKESKERKKSESERKDENDKDKTEEDKDEEVEEHEEHEEEEHEDHEANGEDEEEEQHEEHEDEDKEGQEDKLWEDVDKDLGDLLREVEPHERDEDEEENDSVLNIDIER